MRREGAARTGARYRRLRTRIHRAALELNMEPPSDLTISGWWEQARTLED